MIGTRKEAVQRFAQFVKRAEGKTSIVYQALSELKNPTDNEVFDYIDKKLGKT